MPRKIATDVQYERKKRVEAEDMLDRLGEALPISRAEWMSGHRAWSFDRKSLMEYAKIMREWQSWREKDITNAA